MTDLLTSASLWLTQTTVAASLLILLALGLGRLARQPARRQRLGEWGLAAALLATLAGLAPAWLVVALPMGAPPVEAAAPMPVFEPLDMVMTLVPVPDAPPLVAEAPVVVREPMAAPTPRQTETDIANMPSLGTVAALSLVTLYGVGVVFFLVRWLGGHWYLHRLLRDTEPAPSDVAELFSSLRGSRRHTRLLLSRVLRMPISCGVVRPTVVLPADFCDQADRDKLAWVFAHELTHVERRDAWSALLLAVGQVVFFHLPWFWWLRKNVRLCQEYVADAVAAAERPVDEYAEFLLSLTETKTLPLGATGVAGPVSDLFRRVTMLLQNPLRVEKRCPRLWSLGLAGVMLALAALLGGVGLRAEASDTIIIIIPGQKSPEAAPKVIMPKAEAPTTKHRIVIIGQDGKPLHLPLNEKLDDQVIRVWKRLVDPMTDKKTQYFEIVGSDGKTVHVPASADKVINVYDVGKKEGVKKEGIGELELLVNQYPVQTAPASVDLKKLEKLLEKIQADPAKVDVKEIQKALEELRKSHPTWLYYLRTDAKQVQPIFQPYSYQLGTTATPVVTEYQLASGDSDGRVKLWNVVTKSSDKGRFGLRLGAVGSDLREHLGLPKDQGIVIEEVFPGTPAAKAGLKAKDIILKVNTQALPSDVNNTLQILGSVKDGEAVDVTIIRRGKEEVIKGLTPATQVSDAYLRLAATLALAKIPENGALVTLSTDGDKFTAKHQDKRVTVTMKGSHKDGKAVLQEIVIQIEGKVAYKMQGPGPHAFPEEIRTRVQQLLNLVRTTLNPAQAK